jgi:recombination DNA repair RAD52 pathway protein
MFTDNQITLLADPLDPANVKARKGPEGKTLGYVEGWHALDEANRIFGFGHWSRETVVIEPLHAPVLITDRDHPEVGKVVSCWFAKVRITVWSPDGSRSIVREGCGAARGFAGSAGESMEMAIKAAETDATKRALTTFGYSFGLALYDKERKHVAKPEARPSLPGKAAIDEGFTGPDGQQPRLTTSQRALAGARNGRMTAQLDDKVPV